MILYAGPSLSPQSWDLIDHADIELRPPVQRGDIPALLEAGYRGSLAIADGVFHQVVAVGHAELRVAMELGCQVYGLCSMGAIRAYEMRHLGMQGFGEVYEWFFKLEDFQDDELALYHFPEPDFRPITEPLVHFRACLTAWKEHLDPKFWVPLEIILSEMKERFYGERDLNLFEKLLEEHLPTHQTAILNSFDQYRIKQKDLERFLGEKPWL